MIFRVWAPNADRVALVLNDHRIDAHPEANLPDGGWWAADAPHAKPGDRYAWSLDDGQALPDPRSMDQPQGVHAASRVMDHGAYRWRRPDFRPPTLANAVIYELHIGTFTPDGTLAAAAEHLDHLNDLGATHVELMPLNTFDGDRGWGYDGVAWFAPHPAYTGPQGPDSVKAFVDACHDRGLAVILDVVYNHLGPSGNYLARFGPYFTDAYHTPWGAAMNLDGPGSDETRRLIIDNALMWLRDYRFDALRLDAIHAFHDRSAIHLLAQLRVETDAFMAATGRRVGLIAESDLNDPRVVRPTEIGGYAMDAQWSDDFHHALHALLTGERRAYYADFGTVADLAKAWRHAFIHDGTYAPGRGRRHGAPTEGLSSARFLAYAQNHDQVGNRATGDRLTATLSPAQLELAAALVLLSPFVPMLFQGEEWGAATPFQYFTDHQNPELAEAVRQGRRREFAGLVDDPNTIPDPQDPATFERSKLDWSEPQRPAHRTLLDWHRRLIRFRREHPDLAPGPLRDIRVESSESPPWLRVEQGGLTLLFNLADQSACVPLAPGAGPARALLAQGPDPAIGDAGVELGPFAVAVIGATQAR
jgi:maltooligosyltrehalose trehalohydrolase